MNDKTSHARQWLAKADSDLFWPERVEAEAAVAIAARVCAAVARIVEA